MALASGLAAVAVIALAVPDVANVSQVSTLAPPAPAGIAWLDEDMDGVPDLLDHCPGTSRGFPVTLYGCAVDEDADGVADGADRCPGTRPGTGGFEEPVGQDGCSARDQKKERFLPFITEVG